MVVEQRGISWGSGQSAFWDGENEGTTQLQAVLDKFWPAFSVWKIIFTQLAQSLDTRCDVGLQLGVSQ